MAKRIAHHMQKLKTLSQPINLIFLIQIVVVFLVSFGTIDRFWILPLAALVATFVLWTDLETATTFFVRSVPFFVAIPFTEYFDSFNLWRIASGLIFLRWFWKKEIWKKIDLRGAFSLKKYPFSFFYIIFIAFSILSLAVASDLFGAMKRVIYILNLSLIAPVIYELVKSKEGYTKELLKNILISVILVAGVALAQIFSSYLVTIYDFMAVWGEQIQLAFYGSEWADTVIHSNTWFAYYGPQLSLRVFSTFPDSHSFPVYLLLTIPALLAFSLHRIFSKEPKSFKKATHIRASMLITLLPLFYLLAILSGTRGIWLAVLSPLIAAPLAWRYLKSVEAKNILKYCLVLLVIFPVLFTVAYPVFTSSQFQIPKEDSALFAKRLRSILDLDETSNSSRIVIWKKTLESIKKNPLLGVGIGNYPVVLSQETEYAKAGSSAHNLYLHIAAEIGILGLIAVLGMLWIIFKRGLAVASNHQDIFIKIFAIGFLIYATWVLFYNLTDAILFDERAFLIFAVNAAIILGLNKKNSANG
ncbi:MAG: O-antigen ligase family protein [bacterium]|nr:O-antigen ligase family protein [bacterium]